MVAASARRASLAALFVSVVLGCSSSAHNPSCNSQADCSSGLTCSASECVAVGECASTQASCSDNSTCGAGTSCVNNCCAAFSGCRSNNDCVSTATKPLCNTATNACVACGGNGDCLAGTICTTTGACLQGCGSDANCATGQQCLTGANGRFCGAAGSTPTVGLTPATGTFIRAGDPLGSAFPTHVTVTLSFTVTTPTAVTVTAADADVTIANAGVVTIPAGATSGEVQLSATTAHPSEVLTATLGASTATATIRVLGAVEGPSTFTLTPATPTLAVGGSQTFKLTSDIPLQAGSVASIDYGTLAADFPAAPTSVAFATNASTQTFVVPVDAAATPGTTTITATLDTLVATSNVTVAAVAVGACSPVNSPLVISATYGDGGFAGTATAAAALWQSDYIEIHNRTTSPVSLNGLSVQYAPATSTTNASGVVALNNVTLAAGGYYLVALTCSATGCGAGGSALPTPDQTSSTINMSFNNGKVFLINGTTAVPFDSNGAPTAAAASTVLDAVGYGAANYGENNTKAATGTNIPEARKDLGCTDTNDNAADFDNTTAVAPRNTSTAPVTCGACGGSQL